MKDKSVLNAEPCGCGSVGSHMEHGMRIVKDHMKENCGESLLMILEFAKLTAMKLFADGLIARNDLSVLEVAARVSMSGREIEQAVIGISIDEMDHFSATYNLMFAEPTSEHMQ